MWVDFNAGKTHVASIYYLNNCGAINVNMDQFLFDKNHIDQNQDGGIVSLF